MTTSQDDYFLYHMDPGLSRDSSADQILIRMRSDPADADPSSTLPIAITLASILLAVIFLIRLWRNRGSLFERLFWTVFLFVPIFGPLFFLVFYPSSTELEARRWASINSVGHLGGGGRLGN